MKTKFSKLALSAISTFALAFITSCASIFSGMYPVPENMRKSYEKTIYAPNVSAELLSKKIKLHLFDKEISLFIFENDNRLPYSENDNRALSFKGSFIDEECNLISGLHIDPKGMMRTEIFINSGQYRVVRTIERVIAKQKEIEQTLKNILPEVEKDWQLFIQELEQVTTKHFTDEEIEKLVQQGNTEMQKKEFTKAKAYFLKVAIANPNNAEFLTLYGKSLESIGREIGCVNEINCNKAIAKFNMAFNIFWLVQEHPEAARAMRELLPHKQAAEQRAEQFEAQSNARAEAIGRAMAGSVGMRTSTASTTSTTTSADKSEKYAIQLNKAASNWSSCIETPEENMEQSYKVEEKPSIEENRQEVKDTIVAEAGIDEKNISDTAHADRVKEFFCNGAPYNPEMQFCYNSNQIINKCSGNIYNPTTHLCHSDGKTYSCNNKPYNPATQSCDSNSSASNKCNGNIYNPTTHLCHTDGKTYSCNNKPYNPATQSCDSNSSASNKCSGNIYNPATHFCHTNGNTYSCVNKPYNPATHRCIGRNIIAK